MNQHPLNQLVEDHDCATCDPELKESCALKHVLPVIKFTIDWEAEQEGPRQQEMNEFMSKAEDVVTGAFALMVSAGGCGGETVIAVFNLLIAYGYIMGRKYVEVPKAFES